MRDEKGSTMDAFPLYNEYRLASWILLRAINAVSGLPGRTDPTSSGNFTHAKCKVCHLARTIHSSVPDGRRCIYVASKMKFVWLEQP